MEKRGVRPSWQRQHGKRDQRSEPPAVTAPRLRHGLVYYIIRFTLHCLFPLYKKTISFCRDPGSAKLIPCFCSLTTINLAESVGVFVLDLRRTLEKAFSIRCRSHAPVFAGE